SPLVDERLQHSLPGGRQAVVAPWRARRRLAPRGLDHALAPQPAEERIQRALGRDHAVDGRERLHELDAVALAIPQEREHAVLEGAPPQLGRGPAPGIY